MKGAIELTLNWIVILIAIILTIILAIIFLSLMFHSNVFSWTAKEICLLTIGKLFGKAELCEVFI
ncbi:MAG: hypothetical protein QW472_02930 [Candidatus Aenigmatarchaeota archaeon]